MEPLPQQLTAGLGVVPVDPMYTATKYAVIGMARAVAVPTKCQHSVNVICPGDDTQIVPEEYKAPEFEMMPTRVAATEIVDQHEWLPTAKYKVAVDSPLKQR